MNKTCFIIFLILLAKIATSSEIQLSKKSIFYQEIGYNLFIKITKSEKSKLNIRIVVSNKKMEHITLSNGKIEIEESSFMFPINGNKLFIVSPLRPCKIEFVGHNERKQLNGIEYASDSVFFYILNVDREMEYVKDKSAHILSYIPFEDDDSSFLGLLYYFKSPIVSFIKVHNIERFILSQIKHYILSEGTKKSSFETKCF